MHQLKITLWILLVVVLLSLFNFYDQKMSTDAELNQYSKKSEYLDDSD